MGAGAVARAGAIGGAANGAGAGAGTGAGACGTPTIMLGALLDRVLRPSASMYAAHAGMTLLLRLQAGPYPRPVPHFSAQPEPFHH